MRASLRRKADKKTAQAVGLYAPPPGGHGVLDPRQTNRTGKKYREEALWDGSGDAWGNVRIKAAFLLDVYLEPVMILFAKLTHMYLSDVMQRGAKKTCRLTKL